MRMFLRSIEYTVISSERKHADALFSRPNKAAYKDRNRCKLRCTRC